MDSRLSPAAGDVSVRKLDMLGNLNNNLARVQWGGDICKFSCIWQGGKEEEKREEEREEREEDQE
jgi:hypothetical protein